VEAAEGAVVAAALLSEVVGVVRVSAVVLDSEVALVLGAAVASEERALAAIRLGVMPDP
jgi:hypothetical protein